MASATPIPKGDKLLVDSFKDDTIIKVLVGKEEAEFFIMKSLICRVSPFFNAACEQNWMRGKERIIRLVEDDPKLFGIFLTWVVTGDIEKSEDLCVIDDSNLDYGNLFHQLAGCFILASSLQAISFQNAVMDLILLRAAFCWDEDDTAIGRDPEDIKYVYDNTAAESPLRKFCVDMQLAFLYPDQVLGGFSCKDSEGIKAHFEFSRDLLQHAFSTLNNGAEIHGGTINDCFELPWKQENCMYHVHTDHDRSYSCPRRKLLDE